MPASVIVWDIETIPDLSGFAAASGLIGKLDDEVRAETEHRSRRSLCARLRGLSS